MNKQYLIEMLIFEPEPLTMPASSAV
jgi:hypothetical protein